MLPHPSRSSAASRHGFNPHPARGPGAAGHDVLFLVDLHERFQSSPGPGAGCCRSQVSPAPQPRAVSILTRPGGRVLPPSGPTTTYTPPRFQSSPGPGAGCCRTGTNANEAVTSLFQSSPGPGAGCCPMRLWTHRPPRSRFNPHPARGPGAAEVGFCITGAILTFQSSPGPGAGCCERPLIETDASSIVSILTRPGGRVLLVWGDHLAARPHPVSILTRPGGRVLQETGMKKGATQRVSILTRPGGRVLQEAEERTCRRCLDVSILTRPGGRVLLGGAFPALHTPLLFQSSPGPGAGCCFRFWPLSWSSHDWFQSSPGPGAGCCGTHHAGVRPVDPVSILTRPGGRVLPPWAACLRPPLPAGFNPHPARGPGAADAGGVASGNGQDVSILTRPGGRVLRA